MRTYVKLIGSFILILLIIVGGFLFLKSHSFNLYEKHRLEFKEPVLSVLAPFKNDTIEESLVVEKAGTVSLKIWAECYLGNIDLSISDTKGGEIFHKGGRKLDFKVRQYLAAGKYILRLRFNRVFPALTLLQVTNQRVRTASQPAVYRILPYLDPKQYTRVNPNFNKGFYWPYYLYIPPSGEYKHLKHLLVMPNNTGTCDDNLLFHENAAAQILTGSGAAFARRLGAPLLVPVFPRPRRVGNIYTHALDRDSLLTEIPELKRIDRQLIAMIDDARERLRRLKMDCGEKVLIFGFSAAGMFTNRFAVLHPERVQAAAVGSPGGWPMIPVANYQGQKLRYPIGVADLEQLIDQKFDRAAFQKVPLYFFIGDRDNNDSVPFDDSYDAADRPVINRCFGKTPVTRWPVAERIYHRNFCAAQFVTYPLAGHEVTPQMARDVMKFFRKNQ